MITRIIHEPEPDEIVIYRMTITNKKTGQKIRRANGKPFRIVIKAKA